MRLSIFQVARDFGWRTAICTALIYLVLIGWIAGAIVTAAPRIYGPAAPFDWQYSLWILGSAIAAMVAIMLLMVAALRLARPRMLTAPEVLNAVLSGGPEGDRVRRALLRQRTNSR